MNEASVYTIEREAWSVQKQRDLHFRLTYERVFLPIQNLWREFLVHREEIGSALPTANQSSTGRMTELQGRDAFFDGAIPHVEKTGTQSATQAFATVIGFLLPAYLPRGS